MAWSLIPVTHISVNWKKYTHWFRWLIKSKCKAKEKEYPVNLQKDIYNVQVYNQMTP